jgi:hypothetical protein
MRAALLALALAGLFAPPAAAADTPAALVRKLGHPEFRVREAAAADLARLGSGALQALTEGARSPDAEVADQCKKLLPAAEAADRAEGLAALLRDPTAPPSKRLPGVESFLKTTGGTTAARELYAELVRQHPEVMVARERDPRAAGDLFQRHEEALNARYREALRKAKSKYEADVVTPADFALFLVFAADPRVNRGPRHHVYQNMLVLSKKVRAAQTEGDQAPAFRGLFAHWLLAEPLDVYQRTGFELAAEVRIPELLPRAVRLIADKATPARTRAMAMTALLQAGTKDHLPALTAHLNDKTEVDSANLGGGGVFRTQVRDVALGLSVRLAGEKEEDFGLGDRRFGTGRGVPKCLYYYGFTDDEAREKSHRQWQAWLKAHPEAGPKKAER